jgi:hypothetical protein
MPELLVIDDGTTIVTVPKCSFMKGSISRADLKTGYGEIEYADGHAANWVRFQRRALTVSGNGPVPHGLWALSLSAASWTVTISSFSNNDTTEVWTCVPNRPQDTRDLNTGRTAWTLELRSAVAA